MLSSTRLTIDIRYAFTFNYTNPSLSLVFYFLTIHLFYSTNPPPFCTCIPNPVWCPPRRLRRIGRKKERCKYCSINYVPYFTEMEGCCGSYCFGGSIWYLYCHDQHCVPSAKISDQVKDCFPILPNKLDISILYYISDAVSEVSTEAKIF